MGVRANSLFLYSSATLKQILYLDGLLLKLISEMVTKDYLPAGLSGVAVAVCRWSRRTCPLALLALGPCAS
jgi:hypothetical protein